MVAFGKKLRLTSVHWFIRIALVGHQDGSPYVFYHHAIPEGPEDGDVKRTIEETYGA